MNDRLVYKVEKPLEVEGNLLEVGSLVELTDAQATAAGDAVVLHTETEKAEVETAAEAEPTPETTEVESTEEVESPESNASAAPAETSEGWMGNHSPVR